MAIVIKPITVEVSKPNLFQAIAAKQDDSNSRFLKVTFVNEGETIPVLTTSKVTINAKRSDGQANSFFGEVNDDGTATVPLHSWMLELPGIVNCDTSILDSEDRKLTSTTFNLLVEEAAFSDGDISNDPQTDVLNELLDRVEGLDGGTSPLFAPVVRNEASGKSIKLTDISPIEHPLGLKVGGITQKCEDLTELSNVKSWGISTTFSDDGKINLTATEGYTTAYAVVSNISLKANTSYCFAITQAVNIKWAFVWKEATYDSVLGEIQPDSYKVYTPTENIDVDVAIYLLDNSPAGTVGSCYLKINEGTEYFEGLRSSPVTEVERWGENVATAQEVYNGASAVFAETGTYDALTIPETVQALEGYGDGINETSYNYVDFEKKQFVKRCKRLVFNGTEEWLAGGINNQYYVKSAQLGVKPNSVAMCNLYQFDKSETPINTFFVGSAGIAFNTTFETTEEWKAYLAELYSTGTPLTVLYELETPEVTDISNLLTDVGTLSSISPETNLYTDNANGYLNVAYNADTKKYIDNKFAELQALILNA